MVITHVNRSLCEAKNVMFSLWVIFISILVTFQSLYDSHDGKLLGSRPEEACEMHVKASHQAKQTDSER